MRPTTASPQTLFLFEPQNWPFVEGTTRDYYRNKLTQFLFCLFFGGCFVAGIFIFYGGVQKQLIEWELEGSGVHTTATITGLVVRDLEDSFGYEVRYTYGVEKAGKGSTLLENREDIDESTYKRFSVGDKVGVRYRAVNPGVARLEGINTPIEMLLFAGVCFTLLGAVALVVGVVSYLHSVRREREGCVVYGELTRVEEEKDEGTIYLKAHYRFVNPRQEEVTGQLRRSSAQFRKYGIPEVGTAIAVLYLDDRDYEII